MVNIEMRIEFDYSKLKGSIKERLDTQQNLANALDISETALINKLKNKYAFSQKDIINICKILEIDPSEIHNYFFTVKVK